MECGYYLAFFFGAGLAAFFGVLQVLQAI